MDIRFRQGLVALPANSIKLNGGGGIDIEIYGRPILASIASGAANYTISEARSVSNAWGPFSGSTTRYLFWQLNQRTGEITRDSTVYWPDVRATAPAEIIGRLWWDTNTDRMKRWNGSVWEPVLIVFAATLSSGGILQPQPIGSQVGITAAPGEPGFSSGYILRDGLGNALKTSNASEFLTSETPLISVDTGSLVKFEGSQLVAVANNPLAAFDVVYMVGNSMVDKASGLNLDADSSRAPMGIVTAGVIENETVQVITAGKVVVNEQWNWGQFEIGKSVYCDDVGQMTLTKPSGYKNVRVGIITGNNSILLTFDWETDIPPQTEYAGIQQIHVNAPITKTGIPAAPMIGITRASQTSDGYLHRDDFWRIVLLENQKANVGHTHVIGDVDGLQSALNTKAELLHTHTQADIQGLPLALANKSDVGHMHAIADITGLPSQLNDIITLLGTKADRATGVVSGNFAAVNGTGNYYDSGLAPANFALSGHQHDINDVNLLQDALDGKSDIGHGHAIADVAGLQLALDGKSEVGHTHSYESITGLIDQLALKSNVGHTHEISDVNGLQLSLDAKAAVGHVHSIADVAGLQLALDDKASASHVHSISDVSGLQPALDSKASILHTHTIAQVAGLQIALDSKANTVHTHAIADVTGLQTALDGKAASVHTHAIADVTGLQTALDNRITLNNTIPFTPTGQYNPATKKYVDDRTLDSLLDVNAPSPAIDQFLKWNGSAWVPATVEVSAPYVPPTPDFNMVNVRPFPYGQPGDVRGLRAVDHIFEYVCVRNYNPGVPAWRRTALEQFGTGVTDYVDYGLITDPVTDYLVYDPEYPNNPNSLLMYNNNQVGADDVMTKVDYGVLPEPLVGPPIDLLPVS